MKWLNPLNWFKKAAATAIDQKVDEVMTLRNGKMLVVAGVNDVILLTENKWSDDECRRYARGFRLAGKALTDLADAIDPDGDDGRKLSADEFEVLMADALAAFGTVLDEASAERVRNTVKGYVHEKLGV